MLLHPHSQVQMQKKKKHVILLTVDTIKSFIVSQNISPLTRTLEENSFTIASCLGSLVQMNLSKDMSNCRQCVNNKTKEIIKKTENMHNNWNFQQVRLK